MDMKNIKLLNIARKLLSRTLQNVVGIHKIDRRTLSMRIDALYEDF